MYIRNSTMKLKPLLILMLLQIALLAEAQTPLTVAHRGAWKNTNAPENSIEALLQAEKQKLWAVEFDVHQTKDSVLVVNHDPDFYGIDIATSKFQNMLSKKLANNEIIPTAEAFINTAMEQTNLHLICEIKSSPLDVEASLNTAEKAVALVRALNAQQRVDFIAFSWEVCLRIKEIAPEFEVSYLNGDKTPAQVKAANLDGIDYNYQTFLNNPQWINEAKDLGLKLNVWTVNNKELLQKFTNYKFDYMTTDEPELLTEIINEL